MNSVKEMFSLAVFSVFGLAVSMAVFTSGHAEVLTGMLG
jgi:hypothetical protein